MSISSQIQSRLSPTIRNLGIRIPVRPSGSKNKHLTLMGRATRAILQLPLAAIIELMMGKKARQTATT